MKLLDKLERSAEAWLNSIDYQLNAPLMRVITGEVFADGTAPECHPIEEAVVLEAATSSECRESHTREPRPTQRTILNPR